MERTKESAPQVQTPAGIEQEVYALLVTYQVLRTAMTDATDSVPGLDPDRASFTIALHTARDQLIQAAGVIADTLVDLVTAGCPTGCDPRWVALSDYTLRLRFPDGREGTALEMRQPARSVAAGAYIVFDRSAVYASPDGLHWTRHSVQPS